jgi:hypothetical protein
MKHVRTTWLRVPIALKALILALTLVTTALALTGRVGSAIAECAGTPLHAAHVGANSETFAEDCDLPDGVTLQPGEVLWHFVLTQTSDPKTMTLNATFQSAGAITGTFIKQSGGVLHWYIITPADDVLLSACTDALGKLLNLSHVCDGDDNGEPATSNITTEIHLGVTDNGDPIVVFPCNAKAPAFVHDSSQLITTPAIELPAGSTVTFEFRNVGDCSGNPLHTSAPFDVGGQVNPSIDPALAQGPLSPGSYSYKAIFQSGNETLVLSAVSNCEPFTVFAKPLTPGYWKTHLNVTGGGGCSGLPSGTGCSSNGPFTLTYLPKPLGNYSVDTIGKGADVWARMNCSNSGSNTTQNQNAVGCLAGHLLAAKLNVANGADTCINQTIADADAFLISINYVGPSGSYTGLTSLQRATAINLKNALDAYNNGLGCNNFCQ